MYLTMLVIKGRATIIILRSHISI